MNTTQITLQPNDIKFVFSQPFSVPELQARVNVVGVSGVFNQKPIAAKEGEWNYPFPTMTKLMIVLKDEPTLIIELQNVTNQPTWNLGTQAALIQAIADIQAWL